MLLTRPWATKARSAERPKTSSVARVSRRRSGGCWLGRGIGARLKTSGIPREPTPNGSVRLSRRAARPRAIPTAAALFGIPPGAVDAGVGGCKKYPTGKVDAFPAVGYIPHNLISAAPPDAR